MMQATRPKQSAKQQTISSLKTSTAAVRNSIRIMTSAVAFQRSLFPMEDFKDREYCGIDLKILSPAREDSGARMFMNYLEKGVFDAFQKGFVDRIMLNIHDSDPSTQTSSIVESYTFRIDYDKGRIISEETGKEIATAMSKTYAPPSATPAKRITRDQVVQQTRSLIKSLTSTMAGLPPLPDAKWITFYLSYHDHTPEAYEPPLFESATSSPVPVFRSPAATFRQGGAETGYHSMEVKVRSCNDAFEAASAPRGRSAPLDRENTQSDDDDEEEDEEEADLLASSLSKTKISMAANEKDGPAWSKAKEDMYASVARTLRAKKRSSLSPRQALRESEWATSLSASVQQEFLARFETEQAPTPSSRAAPPSARPPLAERSTTPTRSHLAWSQNSFESERENVSKLSRSKRPLPCPSPKPKRSRR